MSWISSRSASPWICVKSEAAASCLSAADGKRRHIFRPDHRSSFEAAHAFLLTLIESVAGTIETSSPQGPFLDELLHFYPSLLLKVSSASAQVHQD